MGQKTMGKAISIEHSYELWSYILKMECVIWYGKACIGYNIKNDLGYGKGRAPLLLQDIKTNAPIAIDIGVEDLCPERNLHKPIQWREKLLTIQQISNNLSSNIHAYIPCTRVVSFVVLFNEIYYKKEIRPFFSKVCSFHVVHVSYVS